MPSTSFQHVAVPQESYKPRQIGLFRGTADAPRGFGCPIGIQQIVQVKIAPQNRPQNGKESRKTVCPRRKMSEVTQKQVHQQANPYLPTDSIGAVAPKVGQLQRLLDLFEKHFDVPPTSIEFGHRPGTPRQMVGQKDQRLYLFHPPLIRAYTKRYFIATKRHKKHKKDCIISRKDLTRCVATC